MKNICYPQVTQTPLLTLLLRKPSFGFVRPNSATCILANKDGLFVSCCELARNANPDSNPVAPTKPDGVSDGNWIKPIRRKAGTQSYASTARSNRSSPREAPISEKRSSKMKCVNQRTLLAASYGAF
jgi:hypothetical protein